MTNQSWGWDKTISTAAQLTSKNLTAHAHKSVWELEWLKLCFGSNSSSKDDGLLVKNKMFNLCGSLFWERFDFDCCRHCSLSNRAGESGNSPKGLTKDCRSSTGDSAEDLSQSAFTTASLHSVQVPQAGCSSPGSLRLNQGSKAQLSPFSPWWEHLGSSKHPHSYISELIPGSKLYSRRTLRKRNPSNNP